MRWKISHDGHDPRQIDLLAIVALLIVIASSYAYYVHCGVAVPSNTAYIEPSLKDAAPGSRYQFERLGYFTVDRDSTANAMVFNRTVTLRDTWAKIEKKGK